MLEYYNEFLELSKRNPMVAGFIGVWFAGMLTYLTRDVPKNILEFINKVMFIKLTLMQHGWFSDSLAHDNFMYYATNLKRLSSFSYGAVTKRSDNNEDWEFELAPYLGTHIFVYKKSIFWYSVSVLNSTGGEKLKQQLVIKTFIWNRKKIEMLFSEFRNVHLTIDKTGIYVQSGNTWERMSNKPSKTFDNIIIDSELKNMILSKIQFTIENEEFYTSRGLPHKRTIMLHGKSGTGKTSIIKALSGHTNKPLYLLNLGGVTASSLTSLLSQASGGIVVIEDVDRSGVVNSKEAKKEGEEEDMAAAMSKAMGNDLGTLLNAFDGIVEPRNLIIIMTTNHLDKIDEAFLRPGRTDDIIEIPLLSSETINSQIEILYPNHKITESYPPIAGSDLMKLYIENENDFEKFKNHLINDPRR